MTPEIWTIIGVGVALGALILGGNRQLNGRINRVEDGLNSRIERVEVGQMELRERMAHLEGLLEGLREAIVRHRAA